MIIGVSVEMSTPWRGQPETFSNVWHYDSPPAGTSESLALEVVARMRARFFGGQVTFRRVRAWGPTDQGKIASEMLFDRELTGTGTAAIPTTAVTGPKEMTTVCQFNTGRKDTRGNPIYLRKYFHNVLYSGTIEQAMGNEAVSAQHGSFFKTGFDEMKTFVAGGAEFTICDSQGRGLPLGTPAEVLPYARIRQFRR